MTRPNPREAGNPALVAVPQIGAEEGEDLVEEAEAAAGASELYKDHVTQRSAANPVGTIHAAVHSRLLSIVVLYHQNRFPSLTFFKAMFYLVYKQSALLGER